MMGEGNIFRVNVRLCNSSKCHNSWNVEDVHYSGAPAAFESFHYCLMCCATGSPWKHKTHQPFLHKGYEVLQQHVLPGGRWSVWGQRILDVTWYLDIKYRMFQTEEPIEHYIVGLGNNIFVYWLSVESNHWSYHVIKFCCWNKVPVLHVGRVLFDVLIIIVEHS